MGQRGCCRVGPGVFVVLGLYICNNLGAGDRQQDLIRLIDAAELSRESNLSAYTVTEYYTIRNSHFSRPAEVTVEAIYTRGQGKTYKVLSRSGPSLLANGVIDRLLREESEMSRGRVREQAIITSANYEMKLAGRETVDGIACDVIELTPKKKSPHLLKGRMWVDAADATAVKIEGRPPASASFFEGRPQVVREYKKINGFAFAERIHAVSSSFLFGKSTVDIEYRDYRAIAGRATTTVINLPGLDHFLGEALGDRRK
jgi:hypothetical protein